MDANGAVFYLRSEFGMIALEVQEVEHRKHQEHDKYAVTIRDLENGMSITLDVLELESLTRMKHEDFGPMIVDHYPTPEGMEESIDIN